MEALFYLNSNKIALENVVDDDGDGITGATCTVTLETSDGDEVTDAAADTPPWPVTMSNVQRADGSEAYEAVLNTDLYGTGDSETVHQLNLNKRFKAKIAFSGGSTLVYYAEPWLQIIMRDS